MLLTSGVTDEMIPIFIGENHDFIRFIEIVTSRGENLDFIEIVRNPLISKNKKNTRLKVL